MEKLKIQQSNEKILIAQYTTFFCVKMHFLTKNKEHLYITF